MPVRSLFTRLFPPPRPAVVIGSTHDAIRFARLTASSGRPVILFDIDGVGIAPFVGVDIRRATPLDSDIEAAELALIATGDSPRDEHFAGLAASFAMPVHVAGRPDLSSFSMIDLAEGTIRPQDRVWLRHHPYI
jgi:hypothetical protein